MNWTHTALTLALAGACQLSAAATFPDHAITWVVPYTPGGVTDHTSRMIGKLMSDQLGQPVVIDNRPGAGGQTGTDAVTRAEPDGYTVLYGTQGTLATSPALYTTSVKYKPLEDFVAVHGMLASPMVVVVNANSPHKTLQDLVAYAKKNPGKVNMASAGIGTGTHLGGELFQTAAGIKFTHVPYKGSGPAMNDLRGGSVDVLFDYVISSTPHIQAGGIRPLAITGSERITALPDVPTMAESGFDSATTTSWSGIFVPAGTPPATVKKLADAMATALDSEEVKNYATTFGSTRMVGLSQEKFTQFLKDEMVRWKGVVDRSGAKLD